MAEDNGEVWKHIGDLHRKHAELHMAVHDAMGARQEEGDGMHETMKELLAAVKELTAAIKGDTDADRAEGGKKNGTGRKRASDAATA